MSKDLYAVLGLDRNASGDDVKKAYRRLSKEWHPDKHKGDATAEGRFKEINEAYEILSDPQKRGTYDQFGTVGGNTRRGAGFEGFDFTDLAGGLHDVGSIFESFFGGAERRVQREEGHDREVDVEIPLAEAVMGSHRTLHLRRLVPCSACDGKGAAEGSRLVACSTCSGTGQVTKVSRSFFGMIQQTSVCQMCRGGGKVPEKPCAQCGGEGCHPGDATVTVDIPAGIEDGQRLRVQSYGDAGRHKARVGDLYVRVRVRADPRFERDGSDIRSVLKISVIDASLGAELTVETVHGPSRVRVPEGTQPGDVLRLKGKGMPVLGSSRMGDHYVTVRMDIPKKLSREERRLLEEWRRLRE